MATWREKAAPIIAAGLAKYPEDNRERKKALRDAYPFGVREYHPYKIWLDEIRRQTGRKKTEKHTGQISLFNI